MAHCADLGAQAVVLTAGFGSLRWADYAGSKVRLVLTRGFDGVGKLDTVKLRWHRPWLFVAAGLPLLNGARLVLARSIAHHQLRWYRARLATPAECRRGPQADDRLRGLVTDVRGQKIL